MRIKLLRHRPVNCCLSPKCTPNVSGLKIAKFTSFFFPSHRLNIWLYLVGNITKNETNIQKHRETKRDTHI